MFYMKPVFPVFLKKKKKKLKIAFNFNDKQFLREISLNKSYTPVFRFTYTH